MFELAVKYSEYFEHKQADEGSDIFHGFREKIFSSIFLLREKY